MKKSKKTGSERIFDFFVYGVAILLILLIIYPLWFVIIASFSDPADVGMLAWLIVANSSKFTFITCD